MDLRSLKYFIAIAEEKNISQAAKRLNMSQPPLSIELKKLEIELQTTLFNRQNKKLEITATGKLLYEKACSLISMSENIIFDINNIKEYKTLRIGMMSSSSGIILSNYLNDFIIANKSVNFDIYEGNTYELIDKINQNQIEIAIIRTPFDDNNMIVKKLVEEPMVAIGQKKFFNSLFEEISVEDLSLLPLIYYRRFENLLQSVFSAHNVRLTCLCKNEDARTTFLWSNWGLGVGIVPMSATKLIENNLVIKKIAETSLYTCPAIVYKKGAKLSQTAQSFISIFTSMI